MVAIFAAVCYEYSTTKKEADLYGIHPEEMLGAGTVCARMVLQPGCEVGEHTHHGNYEVYYFLSGRGTYRSNGETTTVDAGTVTFTGDGESHFLRNDGDMPLEFLALVLNLPAQA